MLTGAWGGSWNFWKASKFVFKLQNLYVFSPFWRKLNFQLTCVPWRWYLRSNLMKKSSDAANTKLRRHNWFFIILLDSLWNRPQFIGCWSGPFWLFSTIFLFLKTPWQWSTVDFNSGYNLSLGIRFHSWSLTIWIGNIIHQKNGIPLRFQSNP